MTHATTPQLSYPLVRQQRPLAESHGRVRLTDRDDTYSGGDSGEYILALAGNDRVGGGTGDDIIKGGRGNDLLGGGRGRDHIGGGNGNDEIDGGGGHDQLFGGNGDDQLIGGGGRDLLIGGLGADTIGVNDSAADGRRDTVVYSTVEESFGDRVFLFQAGEDRIDLSKIDADTTTRRNDAFHFIGADAFSGTPGELRYDGGQIMADVNGDGSPDFLIDLVGQFGGPIQASDFAL